MAFKVGGFFFESGRATNSAWQSAQPSSSTACSRTPRRCRSGGFGLPRRAHVDHVALRLGKRATLVPHLEGRVYGVLMTLMHSEIDRLYSEASVAAYRPEPVLAQLEDGTAEVAFCFNLPTGAGWRDDQSRIRRRAAIRCTEGGATGALCGWIVGLRRDETARAARASHEKAPPKRGFLGLMTIATFDDHTRY